MEMTSACEVLDEYRLRGSERAFATIVRRYSGLVYSVALRRLRTSALAEEVAQIVFTRLAAAPPRLNEDAALAAWLHRTALHVSVDLWRAEARRRAREEKAMEFSSSGENGAWDEAMPYLDEALDKLSDPERRLILLRFFERKRMADMAAVLGITEDAVKMRVSRVVEKLRGLLAAQGVTITAAFLVACLADRAVEAAPASVIERLESLRAESAAPGVKFVTGRTAALGIGAVALVSLLIVQGLRAPEARLDRLSGTNQIIQASARITPISRTNEVALVEQFDRASVRTLLRIVDGETSLPIAQAAVHMAYFYDGGVGEAHKSTSNSEGVAPIPFPDREGNPGANVFVTVKGYVPKCVNFRSKLPEEYTVRLDRGLTIGGRVVDARGEPTAGVKVTFSVDPSRHRTGARENMAFNAPETVSITDTNGAFTLPFAPQDWGGLHLVAARDEYAVTSTNFTRGEVDSANIVLVIRRGSVIHGSVKDEDGNPVENAKVKELHNYGWRKLSAMTTADGGYVLNGVSDPFKPEARIVVQAEGMASRVQVVALTERSNRVDFVLTRAVPFRGRIVDPNGVPIMNAVIRTDSDSNGLQKYEWLGYSNLDGRFEWNSAPGEEILFWFEKEGYQTIRDLPLTPNGGEFEVTLRPFGLERSSVKSPDGTPIRAPNVSYRYF